MTRILITGTPGVGKTTLSKEISSSMGIFHLEVSKHIKENNLYSSYDEEFDTLIFEEEKVSKAIKDFLKNKESYIVDTHDVFLVSGIKFDHILLLKQPIEILHSRLSKRGYDQKKIKENIECEIFGVVEEEVDEIFGDRYQIIEEEDIKSIIDKLIK